MSVGEAIGWGTASVAVIIAATLTAVSVIAVVEHWQQQKKLRQLKSRLGAAIRAVQTISQESPFDAVRTMARDAERYGSAHPTVEGEELVPIDLADLRYQIGSVAVWELRAVDWYETAMSYIAAYDAGRHDAVGRRE